MAVFQTMFVYVQQLEPSCYRERVIFPAGSWEMWPFMKNSALRKLNLLEPRDGPCQDVSKVPREIKTPKGSSDTVVMMA